MTEKLAVKIDWYYLNAVVDFVVLDGLGCPYDLYGKLALDPRALRNN